MPNRLKVTLLSSLVFCLTECKEEKIVPLGIDFIAIDSVGVAGESIEFSYLSTSINIDNFDYPNVFKWTFEGGTPSTSVQRDPVVVYEKPGEYDVSLRVSNENNSNQLTKSNYVDITKPLNGMVAYFPFYLESNNEFTDRSDFNNLAVKVGYTYWEPDRHGNKNSAALFNFPDEIMNIKKGEELSNLTSATISVWAFSYGNYSEGAAYLIGSYKHNGFGNNADVYNISVTNSKVWWTAASNQIVAVFPLYQWVHIVATVGDGRIELYLNNELQSTDVVDTQLANTGDSDITVGGNDRPYASEPGPSFNGLIDELRIYNRALSDYEVDLLYKLP